MLHKLFLTNFRNHLSFDLALGEITILIGKNGTGKTNVLEAIGLLSYGRSFRGENRLEMINFDSDFARVTAEMSSPSSRGSTNDDVIPEQSGIHNSLEVFIQRPPCLGFQTKERGVKRKIADFVGLLPSVIFSP